MDMSRRAFMGTTVMAAGAMTAFGAGGRKLRACVIGDTKQGGYGHSLHKIWACRDDVEVVGLTDPDEDGRRKAGEEAKALRTYADYREMLEKEKPDLVTIGPRWTIHHKEYLLAAAGCGAHGLMEKPVSTDLVEADEMVRVIEEKNLKWAIGFNFRATPIIEFTRRAVFEEGLIGEVLEMRGRGKEDERAGGEDLVVLGTHIFDMMRFFAGNATWCMADIATDGHRAERADIRDATEPIGKVIGDRIHATFGFGNGVVGHFASTKNRDGNGGRWGLDIYGSKGIVTIRQDAGPRVRLWRQVSWDPQDAAVGWEPLPGAPGTELKNPDVDRYAPIVNDLIASIGEDRQPRVSLRDGRDSLEMIQAVYAAHFAGGRVELPLKERRHPLENAGATTRKEESMEKVRYEEMLPHEIVARRKKFPAAFIGLGGLEWHGEHLAVGNDALKAEKLCELAAARSGGFAFPTLWYGEPRECNLLEVTHDPDGKVAEKMGFNRSKFTNNSYYGKTPDQQIAAYEKLLYHLLVQMNTLEMKAVCLLCGHYPLHGWAVNACDRFNKDFKETRAFAGIEFHYPGKGPDVDGDHAAKWETSYLWYLRPDCIDMSVFLGREDEPLIGVVGEDPRKTASVEIGRKGCDLIVEGMIRKAQELIRSTLG